MRRYFAYSRRRWRCCLFIIGLFGFLSFCSLLYLSSVLLFNMKVDLFLMGSFGLKIEDEISNLHGVEEVLYQGEEGSISQNKISLYDSQKNNSPLASSSSKDVTIFEGENDFIFYYNEDNSKYMMILGHYEQLGKTTVNFMHSGLLAAILNRKIVVPYVRNSRYCGLREGWTGQKRKKTREFLPMENYFDMKSLVEVFRNNNFAQLSSQSEFQNDCSKSKQNIIVYFLYSHAEAESKKYMLLTDAEYNKIITKMKDNSGWTDCSYIHKRLSNLHQINNTVVHKGLCIDPEVLRDEGDLNKLTQSSTCLILLLWRGIGFQRTHFNLTLPYNHDVYLSQIKFSTLVYKEVQSFIDEHFQNDHYISVHIRSERQLLWYSLNKYKKCLDLLVQVLSILKQKKQIKKVFLSSDLTQFGSDHLKHSLNKTVFVEANSYLEKQIKNTEAIIYEPRKKQGLIFRDSGFIALVEMEILARSNHLITLGAGTFQSWMVSLFKKHNRDMKHSWSLSKVCSTELKINNENSKK